MRQRRGRRGTKATLAFDEIAFIEIEFLGKGGKGIELKVDWTLFTRWERVFVRDEVVGNDLMGGVAKSDRETLIGDKTELVVCVAIDGIVVEEELFVWCVGKVFWVAIETKEREFPILVCHRDELSVGRETCVCDLRWGAIDLMVRQVCHVRNRHWQWIDLTDRIGCVIDAQRLRIGQRRLLLLMMMPFVIAIVFVVVCHGDGCWKRGLARLRGRGSLEMGLLERKVENGALLHDNPIAKVDEDLKAVVARGKHETGVGGMRNEGVDFISVVLDGVQQSSCFRVPYHDAVGACRCEEGAIEIEFEDRDWIIVAD